MLHAEAKDRRSKVISHFLLLGVEADALANDRWFGAGGAPNGERHFEADSQYTLTRFMGARAQSMFAGELVGGRGALVLWRDITSHIWKCLVGERTTVGKSGHTEALHLGCDKIQSLNSDKHKVLLNMLVQCQYAAQAKRGRTDWCRGQSSAKSTTSIQRSRAGRAFLKHSVVAPKLTAQSTTHVPA